MEFIKNNHSFVQNINQILHNESIIRSERYNIIMSILFNNKYNKDIDIDIYNKIKNILKNISLNKHEIFQIVFMFFSNEYFKYKLDQFYTPINICNLFSDLMIENKDCVDTCCGTGDLVNYYKGNLFMFDKSKDVIEITKFISKKLNNKAVIKCTDSLNTLIDDIKRYDYCVINPPFGSKTIINDKHILQKYKLTKNKKKEEIGILFIELGLSILNKDGILFCILPDGYLGNITDKYLQLRKYIVDNYKILGIIKLPTNSFKRSGTGVSTSILIIQNTNISKDYEIFIYDAKNIGYILNKKNTPFKYKMNNGSYVMCNNKPILDNDLIECSKQFKYFSYVNKINGINYNKIKINYNSFNINELDKYLILDIKRYLPLYKNIIYNSIQNKFKKLKHYCDLNINIYNKVKNKKYKYIQINSVNTPLFNYTELYGYDMPNRAKWVVKKNDIIVSKLKGNISFCIITKDYDNLVASNGFIVLRGKSTNPDNILKNISIIFANLFNTNFKIQHQYLVTGSIMESISNNNLYNIYITENIDYKKFEKIIESLISLNDILL